MTKIVEHGPHRIYLLGDTHLGRAFINNVPLHRRGDREAMVWEQFIQELNPGDCSFHVHMGDLFDKPVVSLTLILKTARAYIEAARRHPLTTFIVLMGNHDASRDLQATTAFDVFKALTDGVSNLRVLSEPALIGEMLFLPWHPTKSALEIVNELPAYKAEVAFAHYDTDLRVDPFNLIPAEQLGERGVQQVYTGHVHLRDEFIRNGVDVCIVGSMQPYAHGEDADDLIYRTLSLAEGRALAPELKDCCVRIDLEPGEVFDLVIDCLQLQVRKPEEVAADIDVTMGDFSLNTVFDEVAGEFDIPVDVLEQLKTKCLACF